MGNSLEYPKLCACGKQGWRFGRDLSPTNVDMAHILEANEVQRSLHPHLWDKKNRIKNDISPWTYLKFVPPQLQKASFLFLLFLFFVVATGISRLAKRAHERRVSSPGIEVQQRTIVLYWLCTGQTIFLLAWFTSLILINPRKFGQSHKIWSHISNVLLLYCRSTVVMHDQRQSTLQHWVKFMHRPSSGKFWDHAKWLRVCWNAPLNERSKSFSAGFEKDCLWKWWNRCFSLTNSCTPMQHNWT